MTQIFIISLILLSAVTSAGYIFNKYFLKFKTEGTFSEYGILGVIFLSIIAFLLNFFFALSPIISNLIFIFPLLFVFTEKFGTEQIFQFLKFSIVFSFLLIIYLSYSNYYRPDGGWYHLPFSRLITDFKIIFGSASLHPMFGTSSILQYLSSFFHTSLTGVNGVLFVNPLILILFLLFFFEIFIKYKETILKFFSLLILFTIFIEMNRNSELGNDGPGHLFYFYLIFVFLRGKLNKVFDKQIFEYTSLIAVFCLFIKSLYVFALSFPIFIFFKKKLHTKIKNYFNLAGIFLILWIFKNIMISGCMIYPVQITCFENLKWYSSEAKFEISAINTSQFSELHSKGWPDFQDNKQYYLNYKHDQKKKEIFLKDFNWLTEYLKQGRYYNLTKKIDFLIPVIFLFLILSILFALKNNKKIFQKSNNTKKININFLLFSSLLFSIIVCLKLPDGRYLFAYLISMIFFIIIYYVDTGIFFYKQKKLFGSISSIFLVILFSVFLVKNIDKTINKSESSYLFPELNYNKQVFKSLSKKTNSGKNFEIFFTNEKYTKFASKDLCGYHKSPCVQNESILKQFDVDLTNNYIVLKLKK